jgi:hypothetical protein
MFEAVIIYLVDEYCRNMRLTRCWALKVLKMLRGWVSANTTKSAVKLLCVIHTNGRYWPAENVFVILMHMRRYCPATHANTCSSMFLCSTFMSHCYLCPDLIPKGQGLVCTVPAYFRVNTHIFYRGYF